jgi:hypothetical protein
MNTLSKLIVAARLEPGRKCTGRDMVRTKDGLWRKDRYEEEMHMHDMIDELNGIYLCKEAPNFYFTLSEYAYYKPCPQCGQQTVVDVYASKHEWIKGYWGYQGEITAQLHIRECKCGYSKIVKSSGDVFEIRRELGEIKPTFESLIPDEERFIVKVC